MTPAQLAALLGSILALVFAYFPWVKKWFDGLDSVYKPLLNAGLLLVLALVLVGLGCIDFVKYFECSQTGLIEAFMVWLLAIVSNQVTYAVAVRQFKK